MARARSLRPRRSRRGRSAPTSCVGSTVASPSRKPLSLQRTAAMLPNPTARCSRPPVPQGPSGCAGGPFFLCVRNCGRKKKSYPPRGVSPYMTPGLAPPHFGSACLRGLPASSPLPAAHLHYAKCSDRHR
jgi:hypothetical protein